MSCTVLYSNMYRYMYHNYILIYFRTTAARTLGRDSFRSTVEQFYLKEKQNVDHTIPVQDASNYNSLTDDPVVTILSLIKRSNEMDRHDLYNLQSFLLEGESIHNADIAMNLFEYIPYIAVKRKRSISVNTTALKRIKII